MEMDIAMVYEVIARFAFNDCSKYGDPWKITAQEYHNAFCNSNRIDEAKQSLSKVMVGIIIRTNWEGETNKLLELEKKVSKCNSQKDFNDIIFQVHKIISLSIQNSAHFGGRV